MKNKFISILLVLLHTPVSAQWIDGSPKNDYSDVFYSNLPNRATNNEELNALKEVMKIAESNRSPYVLLKANCLYAENYAILIKNGYQVYQREFDFFHNVDYITIFKGDVPTGHNYPTEPIHTFCKAVSNPVIKLKD